MKRYFLATNDVESTSIKYNKQREVSAENVLRDGMPLLLDVYKSCNIQATFFFTGEIAEKFPEIVKMVIPDGHEVACHGYSHADEFAFDNLSYHAQKEHLHKAKTILEDISGQQVRSFRATALRVNEFTCKALMDCGFDIDSSISSQRADGVFSFGARKKLNRLFSPRMPFYASLNNLAFKGDSTIFEIPVSALLIPYIGTTLRLSPAAIRLLRILLDKETALTGKPINFLIHPNEMIMETDLDNVVRRSKNPITYLFAEKIRHKLKQKNLGPEAAILFKEQLDYFICKGYNFVTMSQYKDEVSINRGTHD